MNLNLNLAFKQFMMTKAKCKKIYFKTENANIFWQINPGSLRRKICKKSSVFFIYLLEIENLKEARFLEKKIVQSMI